MTNMMTGQASSIEPAAMNQLRAQFRGALLRPAEEGYDEARRVWNGAIDRRPALIGRCAGSDDVIHAVRFAREHDLLVAIRGGGHSVAGQSVCDGGMMIDLSLMKTVRVDPSARTAYAGGGLLWSDLDRATQPFGLATTGGIISHTGIGGLTLGGGLGHLMRKHGLTVDNVLSFDLITAEGERQHVDADTEPELFWALRGGGGNFGVVTGFEYRLHPVGPIVLGGPIFWPAADASEVLRHLRNFAPGAPDELGITISLRMAPPMPFLPAEQYGRPVIGLILVWAGDPAEGARAIEPLRRIGTPIADAVRPVPYGMIQSMLDGGAPHGMHYYWRSQRMDLSDAVVDLLAGALESMTSPVSQIAGWVVGGAACRADAEATAIGAREAGFHFNVVAAWRPVDPEPARHIAWVRNTWTTLRPHATGVYANFLSDEGDDAVESAYDDRLARLRKVKRRWDPTNFFRLNANVRPG